MLNMKYVFIEGAYLKCDQLLKIHNDLYMFWHLNWSRVFSKLTKPVEIKTSEFRRQSYVSALLTNNYEVIGLTLHTLFNLKSLADLEHHYFKSNYSSHFLTELQRRNLSKIMTIEYLTVGEKFRLGGHGIQAAKYLAALAHRLQIELGVEASVYSCRKDYQVDKLAFQFGGRILNPPGIYNGVETQNLITYSDDIKEPPSITAAINYLWNDRNSFDFNEQDLIHSNNLLVEYPVNQL